MGRTGAGWQWGGLGRVGSGADWGWGWLEPGRLLFPNPVLRDHLQCAPVPINCLPWKPEIGGCLGSLNSFSASGKENRLSRSDCATAGQRGGSGGGGGGGGMERRGGGGGVEMCADLESCGRRN